MMIHLRNNGKSSVSREILLLLIKSWRSEWADIRLVSFNFKRKVFDLKITCNKFLVSVDLSVHVYTFRGCFCCLRHQCHNSTRCYIFTT